MSKPGLLYFSIVVILVSGAFNLFDHVSSPPEAAPGDEFLQHRWVITEVLDLQEGADVTDRYSATIWQFLKGGNFVQFRNDIIENTGEWMLKGNMLQLSIDSGEDEEIYFPQRLRRNELMLKSDKLEVRLLKLSN